MKNTRQLFCAALFSALATMSYAQETSLTPLHNDPSEVDHDAVTDTTPAVKPTATRNLTLPLSRLTPQKNIILEGVQNTQYLEFTLRKDQYVESAALNLYYTPSPALLSTLSHLRVYLNEELIEVLTIDNQAEPERTTQRQVQLALPSNFLTSFNRIRLEFIGHYTEICEDPLHSSLWVDISAKTNLVINEEPLSLANDLAFFPEPFFDAGDMQAQSIGFVFAGAPTTQTTKAATILSSYFGTLARWREMHYPVYYDRLPKQNAIVLATNAQLPALFPNYPAVEQPTIEIIRHPDYPELKLLLVLGKNEADLIQASTALALGSPLLRGRSVTIDSVQEITPRQPYDAPYWTPTNRPVRFAELVDYPSQLETSGLRPNPISLNLNLPPDLFVWRNNGIPMDIKYRFSGPNSISDARLNIELNGQYADSFELVNDGHATQNRLRLPLESEPSSPSQSITIPTLKIGAKNQMDFQFAYQTLVGGGRMDTCTTWIASDAKAVIEGDSVMDFSGYKHYIEMPNLGVFMNSGFPFSRMADYSQTIAVLPEHASEAAIATLLETTSHISSGTGYPALNIAISHNLDAAVQQDADILWIGHTPDSIKARPDATLIYQESSAMLSQPLKAGSKLGAGRKSSELDKDSERQAAQSVAMSGSGNLAAIIGLQAPNFPQRSLVGLLAYSDEDYALLRDVFNDSGKQNVIKGSVAVIRNSGVYSERVGPHYYVGELSWYQLLWYHLADRAWWLAALAVLTMLAIAILIWAALRRMARRRLGGE